MKRILTAAACVLLTGCASLEPPPPLMLSDQPNNPKFNRAFAQIHLLQTAYANRSTRLSGESVWLDGLSITSQVATLGFAAYDAHQDNVIAAALVSGTTAVARTRMDPRAAAMFYNSGISALTCVGSSVDEIRAFGAGPRAADVSLKSLVAGGVLLPDNYDDLLAILHLVLTAAAGVSQPTDALKLSIAEGEKAKTKLLLGIEAQNTAIQTVNDAIQKVHLAVTARQLPDIKAIVDDIAKIKLPTTTSPASPAPGAKSVLSLTTQGARDAFAMQQLQDSASYKAVLDLLVLRVTGLRPEGDAEAISRIKGCVAAFGATK